MTGDDSRQVGRRRERPVYCVGYGLAFAPKEPGEDHLRKNSFDMLLGILLELNEIQKPEQIPTQVIVEHIAVVLAFA